MAAVDKIDAKCDIIRARENGHCTKQQCRARSTSFGHENSPRTESTERIVPGDSPVAEMLEILEANGFEAYVVGGCVRDALLCRVPQDWDIATNAVPDEVKACFSQHKTIETGVKHGTITVISDGNQAEITTYRIDGSYSDYRHPKQVSFTRELESDLARRDFTINAMAYHPKRGLVDIFGGAEDLKNRRIVCVGDAKLRFSEDALRILRAARFASVLGFEIDAATASAMNELAPLLNKISPERVASELCKAITGENISDILKAHTRVFLKIIPELKETVGFQQHTKYHYLDVWQHTVEAVNAAPPDLILRITMLLHDCGKPQCFTLGNDSEGHFYGHAEISARLADNILSRLRFDNATRLEVVHLIKHHCDVISAEPKQLKRLLNKTGEERLRRMIMVRRADLAAKSPEFRSECEKTFDAIDALIDEILIEHQAFSLKDLAINGNDLLDIGFDKGKIIGATLNLLLGLVIDDKIENTREALLSQAKTQLKTYNRLT